MNGNKWTAEEKQLLKTNMSAEQIAKMSAHEELKKSVDREKANEQMKKGIFIFIDAFEKAFNMSRKYDDIDNVLAFAFFLAEEESRRDVNG